MTGRSRGVPPTAAFLATLFLAACNEAAVGTPSPVENERACATDADCDCGVHVTTGECFAGNRAFVDATRQCPDFCSGIDGKIVIRCIDRECKAVRP